jgi:hypothetical protein
MVYILGMDLKTFLISMPKVERIAFAVCCKTTLGHLTNIAYGYKPCGEKLASFIEKQSKGLVSRKDLRPNDWHDIWPELIDS